MRRASALLSVFWLGCTGQIGSPKPAPYGGPRNYCTSNQECGDGSVCRRDLSLCVVNESPAGRDYIIRVSPLGGPAQTFAVEVNEQGRAEAHLEALEEVSFDVRDADGTVVTTRVVVSDVGGALPGHTPTLQSIDVFEHSDPELPMGVMSLLPGTGRYSIKVVPIGIGRANYPPAYFDEVTVTEGDNSGLVDRDGNPLTELTVPVPAVPDWTIRGEVLRGIQPGTGTQPGSVTQPVNGLTVEVIDPATGRVHSTPWVTGCLDESEAGQICGEFKLKHVSDLDTVSFKVSRPSELRYPVVVFEDRLNNTPEQEQSVTLWLDPLSTPVRYTASVENPVMLEGSDSPTYYGLENCVVLFESDDVSGGSVSVPTVTDATGSLSLDLFPGLYRITILPPDMFPGDISDFALHEAERLIENTSSSETGSEAFLLSYRPKQIVRVSSSGRTIAETRVSTTPINHESPHARRSTSQSLSDGSQRLWVDPGLQRMTTTLPPDSGYAFDLREIYIEPSDAQRPLELPVQVVEAPIPLVVQLALTADEGVSVSGAEVEWYEVLDERAILVGRSVADAAGDVVALLPQSIVGTK